MPLSLSPLSTTPLTAATPLRSAKSLSSLPVRGSDSDDSNDDGSGSDRTALGLDANKRGAEEGVGEADADSSRGPRLLVARLAPAPRRLTPALRGDRPAVDITDGQGAASLEADAPLVATAIPPTVVPIRVPSSASIPSGSPAAGTTSAALSPFPTRQPPLHPNPMTMHVHQHPHLHPGLQVHAHHTHRIAGVPPSSPVASSPASGGLGLSVLGGHVESMSVLGWEAFRPSAPTAAPGSSADGNDAASPGRVTAARVLPSIRTPSPPIIRIVRGTPSAAVTPVPLFNADAGAAGAAIRYGSLLAASGAISPPKDADTLRRTHSLPATRPDDDDEAGSLRQKIEDLIRRRTASATRSESGGSESESESDSTESDADESPGRGQHDTDGGPVERGRSQDAGNRSTPKRSKSVKKDAKKKKRHKSKTRKAGASSGKSKKKKRDARDHSPLRTKLG